jgi:endonuclease-3
MKEKVKKIIEILTKEYPNVKTTDLNFSNPLELLVATILSAQCTDKRVNQVTQSLFKKYKSVEDYANADIKTFENEIRQTGFYKNKARNIIRSAKMILEKFNGKVPDSMEKLLQLPGVARKTANIVLTCAFGKIEGIPVDTHVRRLAQRLQLTKNDDPVKIEQDLMKLVDKKYWGKFSFLLIRHGREICNAKKPKCNECAIKSLCPSKI